MRVFVTGATGFVGSAVVRDLIDAGHQVLGMARSDEGAASLAAAGAEVHRGNLTDLDSLRRGAAGADGVIHTAFIHDFTKFKDSCDVDRAAIDTLAAAAGDRPLIVTSGTGLLAGRGLLTEDMTISSGPATSPRAASEETAEALMAQGRPVSIMRLPPSVHGAGDHGFVPILINLAREKGVSGYGGDGSHLWPAVHRRDAARLYRLAIEKGVAGRWHAAAEQGVPFRRIAELIGRRLGVPVEAKGPEHFGWFAHFAAMDCPASAALTRETLGWQPGEPGLLADMDEHYFGA
jgi:nucleoside-diphosphate-sugar epimerase